MPDKKETRRCRIIPVAGVTALLCAVLPLCASKTGIPSPAIEHAGRSAAESTPTAPPLRGHSVEELEVLFFDVHQGDATLLNTAEGLHILIDGGVCRTEWRRFDAAARVIIPYCKSEHITALDILIGTHPDFDHIGGFVTILEDSSLKIGRYLDPGKSHTTSYYRRLCELVKERGIPYSIGRAGQRLDFGKDIKAEILNPPKLFNDNNECSIVLRIQYGAVSFLLTGDAEEEAEESMKTRYRYKLKSTVLKAGHHGSRGSSGSTFLRYVKPKVAVISCGKNNSYGHPHKETLKRLELVGARIYRTDLMGTIIMRTDGKKLNILRRRE